MNKIENKMLRQSSLCMSEKRLAVFDAINSGISRRIVEAFNNKNSNIQNHFMIDRMDKSVYDFRGLMIEIMESNPEKYYYVYQTSEKQFGYLTKTKYLKWAKSNFDIVYRHKIGFRVEWNKALSRARYFSKFFNKKQEFSNKSKKLSLSSNTICSLSTYISSSLRLIIEPIGDGYSVESWVKAYSVVFDQGCSNGQISSCSSCMKGTEEEQRLMQLFNVGISDGGKNLQIWGIYTPERTLVGRFKVWIKNGIRYTDRVYARQEYLEEIMKQRKNLENFVFYVSDSQKNEIFSKLIYIIDKDKFDPDCRSSYMDTMSLTAEINNKIIIRHSISNITNEMIKELSEAGINDIGKIRFRSIRSVNPRLKLFLKCSKCGKKTLDIGGVAMEYDEIFDKVLCQKCGEKYMILRVYNLNQDRDPIVLKDELRERSDAYCFDFNHAQQDLVAFSIDCLKYSYKKSKTSDYLLEKIRTKNKEEYDKIKKMSRFVKYFEEDKIKIPDTPIESILKDTTDATDVQI